MKTSRLIILLISITLISSLYVNFKVVRSSYFQAFLMYDFNKDLYTFPYEKFGNQLDVNLPNLTHTALPMKFIKARYLLRLDSVQQAKELLYKASKDNSFVMASEEMLARIFLQENNLDSAYFYSQKAFFKMPNVNPHRYIYFRVLQERNSSDELDNAFLKIKNRNNPFHWYDFIYTKFKLNNKDSMLSPLISEFKKEFPNEDFSTIDQISNFLEVGSQAYTLSIALSSLADSKFKDENYQEAADLYLKAITINPQDYLNYENAAISFDLSKNYDKATNYYDIVLNDFITDDGRSEFYKGLMLIKLNKINEGCKLLKISTEKNYVGVNTGLRALSVYNGLCQNN